MTLSRAGLDLGEPVSRRERVRSDELLAHLEQDFDRRALIPRLLVLSLLAVSALLEYGHGHRTAHWVVLAVYGLTTLAWAVSSRREAGGGWIPWAATVIDAVLTVYVIASHLPDDADDALHAADAVSLLPAFLLLLQTGLRLRRDLVVVFASVVAAGWLTSVLMFVGSDTLLASSHEMSVAMRQALGFLSFCAAAGFVLYAVHQMRISASEALQARLDRMLLSRFLPEGVAADVVRGDGAAGAAERHASLLVIDIRGFSAYVREHSRDEAIGTLMEFRRLVHNAVSAHGGIVDKYLGDGVLALFLEGAPELQAESALRTVKDVFRRLEEWNERRISAGEAPIRVIAGLHSGRVLAGVFDDGRRSEFTVLGPAMNALARIERRAKEEQVDVMASKKFVRLLPETASKTLETRRLGRRADEHDLPDVAVVGWPKQRACPIAGG